MSFSFLPSMILPALTDITPQMLAERNIKYLFLDFDNTIVPYTTNEPTAQMDAWLNMMHDSDIGICVVSNSKRDRVVRFCKGYGIDCVTHARKPFPKGIHEALARFSLKPSETALAGDQIFTDTLGANCAGLQSILVTAIDNHNIWLKLRHVLEIPFIALGRLKICLEREKN